MLALTNTSCLSIFGLASHNRPADTDKPSRPIFWSNTCNVHTPKWKRKKGRVKERDRSKFILVKRSQLAKAAIKMTKKPNKWFAINPTLLDEVSENFAGSDSDKPGPKSIHLPNEWIPHCNCLRVTDSSNSVKNHPHILLICMYCVGSIHSYTVRVYDLRNHNKI